jgi:hypothetical protein
MDRRAIKDVFYAKLFNNCAYSLYNEMNDYFPRFNKTYCFNSPQHHREDLEKRGYNNEKPWDMFSEHNPTGSP